MQQQLSITICLSVTLFLSGMQESERPAIHRCKVQTSAGIVTCYSIQQDLAIMIAAHFPDDTYKVKCRIDADDRITTLITPEYIYWDLRKRWKAQQKKA